MSTLQRTRVVIANRADGGVFYWLGKLYGFTALVLVVVVVVAAMLTYDDTASEVREPPDLSSYARVAPGVTRLYAADGTLMGEFAREWREITPYEKIPKRLVDAVLAVEDHDFFTHRGIYFKGIVRAAWANVTAGDFAQGGSTITQQVAKQFLTNEKSLTRKAKEAILARRLEAKYSKKAILSVYLNHIFFGAGAYGVAAAAQRYFQKDLDQLTLAEAALIAGLPKAPSAFSPIRNPEAALARRDVVLDKMEKHGFASAADVAAAKAEPLRLQIYKDVFPERMPYYAEHVRRYVAEKHGDGLMDGGLRVEAAVEPTWDAAAYENIDYGAHKQDKRQGWRGPEWYVEGAARETLIARQKERYGSGPLAPDQRYLAVVDTVDGGGAEVVIGERRLELPLRNMRWAAPWEPGERADNDREISNPRKVLKPGDVVWVSREIRSHGRFREWYLPDGHNPSWRPAEDEHEWDEGHPELVRLEQVPHPQSALITGDHQTGYVTAMVGGYDYARSEYNRAFQSCRQPGSTYKPIYYSKALDDGYGFDTILNDIPRAEVDPITGEVWTPTNLNGTIDNDVTLEYAMTFSKNIPSVDIFNKLGAKNVEEWARRLGFTSEIIADKALALGASCTYLHELTKAFAIFAREGRSLDWVFVRRVIDRDGNVVEDNTVEYDPMLVAGDRLDRLQARAGVEAEQAISPRTAYLTTRLLSQVVKFGFSKPIRATDIYAAGKTGTSSATMDTLFVAFTSRFITTVWMGDDKRERALGRNDAAFMTVEPLWARYMYEAGHQYPNPEVPWRVPPGINPRDRGDHSKGSRGAQMDLVYRHPERPPEAPADGVPVEGSPPPTEAPGT